MFAALSHITAARFWHAYGAPRVPMASRLHLSEEFALLGGEWNSKSDIPSVIPVNYPEEKDLLEMRSLGIIPKDEPIHLVVSHECARKRSKGIVWHVCSVALPQDSFVALPSGLAVCRPELAFVQMAPSCSKAHLVRLGFMLCGIYATDPQVTEVIDRTASVPSVRRIHKLPSRAHVTTKNRILSFLDVVPTLKGVKRAKAAARYVHDNSRSPMETVAALLLALPYRMGGYALPCLRLNAPLDLDCPGNAGQELSAFPGRLRRNIVTCDVVFEHHGKLAAVEYQGGIDHTGQENIYRDSLRGNAMGSAGVHMFTLTKEQIFDPQQLDRFAHQVARHLGVRIRPSVGDFLQRQQNLRKELFSAPF